MMTIRQKLQLIQKISGLTQEKLAGQMGVSFPTFNSWINGRSLPRRNARERIDALYREYTGQKVVPDNVLRAKKQIIARKSRQSKNILRQILKQPDLADQFVLSLTYHTNRIEGSTLTEPETSAIMFKNIALPNKDMIEQLEVKNHQTAWQYLLKYLTDGATKINEGLILKLHGILLNSIQLEAGAYRQQRVRIAGANVPTANYLKVPALMVTLVRDINRSTKDPVSQLAITHSRFEKIHPFSDGNGRIGRLLMQAMALRKNLPPVVIRQEKKRFYYAYLNKAQVKNDSSLLEDFICDVILEGFELIAE
ncbi:MAG: Fic family protein [Planctomycetes bacterium]|nr:Fic family protein [Planctomycetota bacterium]